MWKANPKRSIIATIAANRSACCKMPLNKLLTIKIKRLPDPQMRQPFFVMF